MGRREGVCQNKKKKAVEALIFLFISAVFIGCKKIHSGERVDVYEGVVVVVHRRSDDSVLAQFKIGGDRPEKIYK